MDISKRPQAYVAHTPSKKNPQWHLLTDHIFGVTDRAVEFAEVFDPTGTAADWARYLGLLHDLGKLTDKFQEYLWGCHRAEVQRTPPPKPGSAPHKQMGALAALEDLQGAAEMFALPIYGHHGGMETPSVTRNKTVEKTSSEEVSLLRRKAAALDARLTATAPSLAALAASPHARSPHQAEMFVRMLFSCLVDADSLDTEQHMNPDAAGQRQAEPLAIPTLRDRLKKRQEKDYAGSVPSAVNDVRREVYHACVEAAKLPPGVFNLTVPTGGGKTRSGLAFALEHAVRHDRRRVVYAIPYTSIVDQTATVFRDVFGDDPGTILEHHSAIEPKPVSGPDGTATDGGDAAELWRRLAAQNWDAPLIVTTTVQLFESLFSNRPGACRKLHRLANSVIVLDEVQTLPAHLLTPLVDGLKILVENFGATVVLCTATQPALEGKISRFLEGFPKVQPIIAKADRDRHFSLLRRVRYRVETEQGKAGEGKAGEGKADEGWDWPRIAAEMRKSETRDTSCLCILNTRRQARQLMDTLDPDRRDEAVFHLSTLMCGHHRRAVLNLVRQRLRDGLSTQLISTSLVECGVDLDFPRVLRAVGPLDRIIQAAGRCNREGRRPRDTSEVVIFTPAEGGAPGGLYRMALQATIQLYQNMQAKGEEIDFDDPALVTRYFQRLYSDLQGGVDKAKDGDSVQERRAAFDFREVAKDVRLVDEDTVSVLVYNYDEHEAASILAEANAIGGMTRQLWQRAQPLCVSLPRTSVETGKLSADVALGGLYVWRGGYDDKTGIPLPEDMAGGPAYKSEQLMA